MAAVQRVAQRRAVVPRGVQAAVRLAVREARPAAVGGRVASDMVLPVVERPGALVSARVLAADAALAALERPDAAVLEMANLQTVSARPARCSTPTGLPAPTAARALGQLPTEGPARARLVVATPPLETRELAQPRPVRLVLEQPPREPVPRASIQLEPAQPELEQQTGDQLA